MRFSTRFVVLGLFAAIASAQTPIPPTETAPTGSVTRTVSDTVTTSGTALPSSSVNGTITASGSLNSTATLSATSTTPTTTSYPSLGGASTCVANCLQVSISQANCSTIIDVNCYCNSTQFRSGLVQCVASNCPQDLSSAENYGQQFCNIVSVSLTYPPAPSSTSRASSSVSPPTGAPLTTPTATATTTPNAAAASRQVRELGWGLAAALLGVFAI